MKSETELVGNRSGDKSVELPSGGWFVPRCLRPPRQRAGHKAQSAFPAHRNETRAEFKLCGTGHETMAVSKTVWRSVRKQM